MSDRYKGAILSPTAPTVIPQSAGGVYTLSQQTQYQGQGVWPSAINNPVNNSLRFRSSASAYLNRTPSTTTNRQIWTWSAWVKQGNALNSIFSTNASDNNSYNYFGFSSDSFRLYQWNGSSYDFQFITTPVYRDPSAWYHFVIQVDTTQSTAANRVRFYVNGVQVTAFSTNTTPSQNLNTYVNNSSYSHLLCRNPAGSSTYFDGYLAEVNFIDGVALTPSSFGTTDIYGVWQPIPYTGSYGTNGFYLPFLDKATATFAGSFNGSTQYLDVAQDAAFSFGTGDFTVEAWVNANSWNASANPIVALGNGAVGGGSPIYSGWAIRYDTNANGLGFYRFDGTETYLTTGVALNTGQWHHIAVSRTSSVLKIFINGTQAYSASNTTSYNNVNTNSLKIGGNWTVGGPTTTYLNGQISNVRIVKGTGLYTANFIPPVANLTAVSGTSLLTLQGSTIVDNSPNAFTINNYNSVTTSTQNVFDGASITSDQSGNANNWTPNNLNLSAVGVTYDSMKDVPTNTNSNTANYCTWNPLDKGTVTVTNGNLSAVSAADTHAIRASMGLPLSGKFYWETTVSGLGYGSSLGIANATSILTTGASSPETRTYQWGSWFNTFNSGIVQYGTNQTLTGGTNWSGASQLAANDVLMIAVDMDNGSMWVGKNGTWFNSSGTANPATNTDPRWTGLTGTTWFPYYSGYGSVSPVTANINFGQQPFTYTPPSGFYPLNTYNLPTPTILDGDQYMDVGLYTGTGSATALPVSGPPNPDFVWIKSRSNALSHSLLDRLRDATDPFSIRLYSNNTNAEYDYGSSLLSTTSTGFNLTTTDNDHNTLNYTYVAWQWKANGSGSSNTQGTITSTVSANTTAGFSIVTYTGNGSNSTIGHGLGVAPSFIIAKARNSAQRWTVYTAALGNGYYGYLNETFAFDTANASLRWNTAPTSSVFGVGTSVDVNNNTTTYVAYCFSQVAGYSAFGSYTGNGSTDGPFIYTGFRPRYILWKNTSAVSGWGIRDTSRNPSNVANLELGANTADAEITGQGIDILSNGFKMRTADSWYNSNGATYIFMAFAENPFKIARAR